MKQTSRKSSSRPLLWLKALLAFFCLVVATNDLQAAEQAKILVADISGPISPAKAAYLKSAIHAAEKTKAKALVIKINTPGGLLSATKEMVEAVLASEVPVVAYIAPSGGGAMSAGVFIALAADIVYMAPGTTIGAAHPVRADGGDLSGDMRRKLENYAVSLVQAINERRGRDSSWPEKAVRESATLTAEQALENKVIDGLASDMERLLTAVEGSAIRRTSGTQILSGLSTSQLHSYSMSIRQSILDILCNPSVALLCGSLAMILFLVEFAAPGGFIAGTIGAIFLVISLAAAQTLPLEATGLILLGLAFILFVVELMVPTFGFWGIAGIICFVLGSLYFVDQDMIWSTTKFVVSPILISLFSLGAACVLLLFLGIALSESRKMKALAPSLRGKRGEIITAFRGSREGHRYGRVLIDAKPYPANFIADQEVVLKIGTPVRIVGVSDGGGYLLAQIE